MARQLSVGRFEIALRAGGIGTWRWDIAANFVDWDASMEELYGFAPGTFDGTYDSYATRLHPEDRPGMEAALAKALRTKAPVYTVEHRVILPGGEVRWFASTAQMTLDAEGEPAELIGVAVDVTDRRLAEAERAAAQAGEGRARVVADEAQRRMHMLARASTLLDVPFNLDETLQQVAELAVGEIADWCVVDVLDDSRVHHAAVAHRDPAMVARAREIQKLFPTEPDDPMLLELQRTLKPVFVPVFDDQMLREAARSELHLELLASLDLSSYVAVPLVANGLSVGTMILAAAYGRTLRESDVDLAVELGRRAGSAVDKARVYQDLHRTAQTLQASLLPPVLPVIPALALSAFYRSGTQGIDIGGDYYDVFRTHADRWWVVLGDVCGKGPGAAALAAAVRYTLRALAPDTDDPALLVRRLNDVLLGGEWGERFTTVIVATFSARPGTHEGDAAADLSLVSGGHPSPLLRRADGTVVTVPCAGTLVGVLPDLTWDAVHVELRAGETLLLYTDGATEARDDTGHELGQGVLADLFAGAAKRPFVGDVTSGIAGRLHGLASGVRDDLALLALSR